MSRHFLTSLNLNKNELLNAAIQSLSTPPLNPATGQIYFDTDTTQLTLWDGTAWVSLAAGGNVDDAIQAAIDLLTTDDIEEGTTNKYYSTSAAKTDAANLLTGATLTNITITGDGDGLTITAENGVADSTTDDLDEGTTNKYYSDTLVDNHLTGGDGITYSSGTIDADLASGGGLGFTVGGEIEVDRTTVDTWYDASGAAATALTDAQAYADALVQGLNVKDSVRAATAIPGIMATDFDNGSTVGGVTVATGDRILIKNQSPATENGIYVVNASGAPTRAADADPVADELNKGSYVLVTDGTYAATGWVVTTYSAGATTWTQFSAANEYTAGTNIAIVDNEISFDGTLPVANGGTGATTAAGAKTELGFTTKYSVNNPELTVTSGSVSWPVTHGLSTTDVTVKVYDLATDAQVEVDVVLTSTSVVTLSWVASATVSADSYRVVVVG